MRNFMKNMKSMVDTKFFKNSILREAFRVVCGALFLNLQDDEIMEELLNYLEYEVPSRLKGTLNEFKGLNIY